MNFLSLVENVLSENNVAGGATSAFGTGVSSTATAQSGDNYATDDARVVTSLYGGTITRRGLKPTNKNNKSRKGRKSKKGK